MEVFIYIIVDDPFTTLLRGSTASVDCEEEAVYLSRAPGSWLDPTNWNNQELSANNLTIINKLELWHILEWSILYSLLLCLFICY